MFKITVDDLIKDSTPGDKTRGDSEIRHKPGGVDQANKDFDDLGLTGVKDIGSGKRAGTLANGNTVVVRPESSDGGVDGSQPTIEIQIRVDGKVKEYIKIRYGN